MNPNHLITDKSYLAPLEGWRGVVSLFVVVFHFYGFFSPNQFAKFGYLGVDFFFILSGFIISRQYEAAIALRTISFTKFCIKRIARLYPLYIFSIALFLYINAFVLKPNHIMNAVDFGMGPTYSWRVFLQLTMLSNIGGMAEPWNGPAWSVSVEWIVNLVYFSLVWKFRAVPSYLLWASIVVCTVYLVNISPHTLHLSMSITPIFNETIARGIVGFSLGVLIYRYHQKLPVVPWILLFCFEIALGFTTVTLLYWHEYPFIISSDYVFQLILFPAIIAVSLYKSSLIGLFFGLWQFRFLGRISYSIYLLHLPLGYMFMYSSHFSYLEKPMSGIMFMLLMLGVSTASYVLIETPFRYLGKRLSKNIR
jgi:peptidoglycan/LPS O-acetylase OafA/YrhL